MSKYFGTDGFRGEAGITLTADHAYKVGRFLGWYYNMLRERNGDTEPARIVIGKDTRRSSYMFEYSLVAGLTASGADAYGSKCILQLRGVRPFLSDKFDITKHKRYKELSDFDKKNAFDVERYLKHELRLRMDEEFDCYEVDVSEESTA